MSDGLQTQSLFNRALPILSLVVASFAAGFTGYQVIISKQQSTLQLRAYAGSYNLQLWKTENKNHLFVTMRVQNYGATPASRVNLDWHTHTELEEPSDIYRIVDQGTDKNEGKVIFSNDYENINYDFFINELTQDFVAGRRVGTVYGTIYYHDIFGASRKTSFCYVVKPADVVTASNDDANSSANDVYLNRCGNTTAVD